MNLVFFNTKIPVRGIPPSAAIHTSTIRAEEETFSNSESKRDPVCSNTLGAWSESDDDANALVYELMVSALDAHG